MTSTYRQVVSTQAANKTLSLPVAKPLTARSSYRPEIDGLRALAVIAVIIYHFNARVLPSGFLGVDIFFVISGFVVTASLSGKPDQSWQDYLLTFYAKRIKRLIPALVVCVALTGLLGCLFIDVDLTRDSLRTGISSLFGVSNLYILRQKTDYFGQASDLNLFTQTWSLGVETQFYLVFPILLGLCGYSRKRRWQGGRNLFWAVLILSVASLVGYLHVAQHRPDVAFFLMSARFWELGAGSLMFLLTARAARGAFFRDYCKRYAQQNAAEVADTSFADTSSADASVDAVGATTMAVSLKPWLAPLSVLGLIGLWFVAQDLQTASTVCAVIFTCTLIGSFEQESWLVKVLSHPWLVKIGVLSYSLYLWHWSVIVLSRWTIGISKWTIPVQLLLILGCAIASNTLIEEPLRYAKWSSGRVKTIVYGLVATILSAFWLTALDSPLRGRFYTGNRFPEAYISSFGLADDYEPCNDATIASDDFAECAYPQRPVASTLTASPQPKTIYFVGDSHNGSIQALASRLVERGDVPRIVMLERDGCLFSLSLMRADTDGKECLSSNRAFLEKVMKTGNPGDVVVLTNRQKLYFLVPNALDDQLKLENGMFSFLFKGMPISREKALEKYLKDLASVSNALSEKGISLVVQGPLPDWKQRPSQCYPQWFRPGFNLPESCELDATLEAHNRMPLLAVLRQQEASLPNLHVYDPFSVFCDDDGCKRVLDSGIPLFRDADHLNNYGAEYLYEDFIEYLKSTNLIASK